jgi:hypothetical protein
MRRWELPALGVLLLLALAGLDVGCRRPAGETAGEEEFGGPAWFEDVTDQLGIEFLHDAGPTGRYFMPQIMGSGCAVFDFDGDGLPDLYFLQNGGPKGAKNRLYRQLPGGKFQDVSRGSGLDIAGYNMGVAVGDVNNDGLPDVLLTQYGGVKLFLNNGNGTFKDVTKQAGLDNPHWGTSAAFVDYDRDGWLDVVIVNYVDYDPSLACTSPRGEPDYCHPSLFMGSVARLYRNRGRRPGEKRSAVHFQDVTVSSGLGRLAGPGLGVVCADFDGDGWPDIFVANDAQSNCLWMNRHNGTFTQEALARGLAFNGLGLPQGNMGIALGDVDGDGLFDVFVTHLTEEHHTLWRQGPRGLFQDRTAAAGLARPLWRGTGFGTVLADFDNDGALDIAVVNGRVTRGTSVATAAGLTPYWAPYAERNQLFANDGKGSFRDVSRQNRPFCSRPNVARGLACADLDRDGAVDLVVTSVAGRARLFRNIAPGRGHWLAVRVLLDKAHGGRDAYGAEVTVRAGGRRWTRLVNPGFSYLSSCDTAVHFGLGEFRRVDSVCVRWPDGRRQTFAGCGVDRKIVLRQGQGGRTDGKVSR